MERTIWNENEFIEIDDIRDDYPDCTDQELEQIANELNKRYNYDIDPEIGNLSNYNIDIYENHLPTQYYEKNGSFYLSPYYTTLAKAFKYSAIVVVALISILVQNTIDHDACIGFCLGFLLFRKGIAIFSRDFLNS